MLQEREHGADGVDLEATEDDISEIQAEISHLRTCSSDQVTRYYGSFVKGYRLWIVMEYLAGGSCLDLVSLLDRGRTDGPAETRRLHRTTNCYRVP